MLQSNRMSDWGFLNVKFGSFSKQVCCRGVFTGSPESLAAETLKAIELLCYMQLFLKISWWCIIKQWSAVTVSSYSQLQCSNPFPYQEKRRGKKTGGSRKEKESFVLQNVGCIFYSIKAAIGKGSAFGPIYPSLQLCRVWMNCSVSHGDRSELCWRLKSVYMVFTLSNHVLFCTQSLFCQAPQCWVNSNKKFSISHLCFFI